MLQEPLGLGAERNFTACQAFREVMKASGLGERSNLEGRR
jgi:hypothetical protein